MATNLVKVTDQTAVVWADTTDYSSTVTGLARTHAMDLTGVTAAAAYQGAKADFGATRDSNYRVYIGVEIASLAASGETIDIYHASSPSATAGTANPGGTSGTDAAYTGTAGDSLADSLLALQFVGSLVTTADNTTVVQYGVVGVIDGTSIERYGMPVLVNNSAGALMTDAVEMLIAYIPVDPDVQAAV